MTSAVEALTSILAAHPRAWVGAVGPDALYIPIPASVPVAETHRRLQGRWALDHVAVGDRAPMSVLWRRLKSAGHGYDSLRVRLVSGGTAVFHLFKVEPHHGADVLVALADDDADLLAPPIVQGLIASSRFTRTLRDEAGLTIEIDDAAPEVLGWSAEELLTRSRPVERVHADDHHQLIESWMATLGDPATGHRIRIRILRSDGTYRWFEVTHFNRLDDPHKPCIVSEFLDISEEMAAHEAVRASEQLLRRLAEALPLGVLQLDGARRIAYKNDLLDAVLGAEHASTVEEQFAGVVVEDRPILEGAFAGALAGTDGDVVVRLMATGGRPERLVRVTAKSLGDDNAGNHGVIACVSDVTEAERMGRELERRATLDALTGCLNRSAVLVRLQEAMAAGQGATAAIFLDLDGFKEVNDRYGHAVGDEMLKAVGHLLAVAIRRGDAVGRLGGDEFLAVCPDVTGEREAMELAERISAAINGHPTAVSPVPLSASIGVAWAGRGAVSPEDLVARADAAMYAAKRGGTGRPHLWRAVEAQVPS